MKTGPEAPEPSAYVIEKFPPFFTPLDDFAMLYLPRAPRQPVHDDAGTQRSAEPVSKSTKNETGGVPIVMLPAHSSSSLRSVRGTFCRLCECPLMWSSTMNGGMVVTPSGRRPVLRWKLSRLLRCLLC